VEELSRLAIGERMSQDDELRESLDSIVNDGHKEKQYINSYDRVLLRHEAEKETRQYHKFCPNRTAKQNLLNEDNSSRTNNLHDQSQHKDQQKTDNNDPAKQLFQKLPRSDRLVPSGKNVNKSSAILEEDGRNEEEDKETKKNTIAYPGDVQMKKSSAQRLKLSQDTACRRFGNAKYNYDECLQDLRTPSNSVHLLDFAQIAALHAQQENNAQRAETLSETCGTRSVLSSNTLRYRDTTDVGAEHSESDKEDDDDSDDEINDDNID